MSETKKPEDDATAQAAQPAPDKVSAELSEEELDKAAGGSWPYNTSSSYFNGGGTQGG